MVLRASPMSSTLFLVSMIGFFISVIYIPQISETWATAFAIVFAVMFVSGMLSMAHALPGPQLPTPRKRIK